MSTGAQDVVGLSTFVDPPVCVEKRRVPGRECEVYCPRELWGGRENCDTCHYSAWVKCEWDAENGHWDVKMGFQNGTTHSFVAEPIPMPTRADRAVRRHAGMVGMGWCQALPSQLLFHTSPEELVQMRQRTAR